MKQYTDITIMLDRSGSMESIKKTMESALDELMIAHRKNPTTKFTLVQFDGENPYELVFENRSATEVPEIKIYPRGSTPLIDCLCQTIDKTGQRLSRMNREDRPDQVLMIVITDGQENTSREFKRSDVKNKIAKQRDGYNWQFMFLGADENAFNEAVSWGIPQAHAIRWFDTSRIDPMIGNLVGKTISYTSNNAGARGMSVSLNYTADERKQFSEKLPTQGTGDAILGSSTGSGSAKGTNGTS